MLIPIFVSITGAVLAEVLKGRILGSLSKPEAKATLEDLKGRLIVPRSDLRGQEMDDLRRLLAPYGVSDDEIRELYRRIRDGIEKRATI
jgi:hypothetical protein